MSYFQICFLDFFEMTLNRAHIQNTWTQYKNWIIKIKKFGFHFFLAKYPTRVVYKLV